MPHNPAAETALGRGVRIIDYVATNGGARFSDIRGVLGNPSPSLVSRLLSTLCELNVLRKTADGCYACSSNVKRWGRNVHDLKDAAMPFMEEIHREFGVSVVLFEKFDGYAECVARLVDENSPGLMPPGARRTIPSVEGMGTVFLSTEEELAKCPTWTSMKRLRSEEDMRKLRESFAEARRTGVWYEQVSVHRPNFARVASPITVAGETVGILGIGTTHDRCADGRFIERLKTDVLRSAREISRILAGNHRRPTDKETAQ